MNGGDPGELRRLATQLDLEASRLEGRINELRGDSRKLREAAAVLDRLQKDSGGAGPSLGLDAARVAQLVEAGRTVNQIAAELRVAFSSVRKLLDRKGARARYSSQPEGTEPRPHIGRLLDESAPAAPPPRCPRCGTADVRGDRLWKHVEGCSGPDGAGASGDDGDDGEPEPAEPEQHAEAETCDDGDPCTETCCTGTEPLWHAEVQRLPAAADDCDDKDLDD